MRPLILLAEDSADDQFFFRRAITQMRVGIPMVAVSDGGEALSYLKGEKLYADRAIYPLPTLLVLDLNLPKVHGLEVLRQVKEHPEWQQINVVVLSGSMDARTRQQAQELGAAALIEKPPSADQLRGLFESVLGRE